MRTKRLYRVEATWSTYGGRTTTRTRDYQTREAAQHRAGLWLRGAPGDDYSGLPHIEPALSATIRVSEPVAWSSEPSPWTTPAAPIAPVDTPRQVF